MWRCVPLKLATTQPRRSPRLRRATCHQQKRSRTWTCPGDAHQTRGAWPHPSVSPPTVPPPRRRAARANEARREEKKKKKGKEKKRKRRKHPATPTRARRGLQWHPAGPGARRSSKRARATTKLDLPPSSRLRPRDQARQQPVPLLHRSFLLVRLRNPVARLRFLRILARRWPGQRS